MASETPRKTRRRTRASRKEVAHAVDCTGHAGSGRESTTRRQRAQTPLRPDVRPDLPAARRTSSRRPAGRRRSAPRPLGRPTEVPETPASVSSEKERTASASRRRCAARAHRDRRLGRGADLPLSAQRLQGCRNSARSARKRPHASCFTRRNLGKLEVAPASQEERGGSDAFPGIASQISSAVNGQIGERAVAIVSTRRKAAVCAERRTGSGRSEHVERVLPDVAPEGREVGRDELEELPHDGVELVALEGLLAPSWRIAPRRQGPSGRSARDGRRGNGVLRGVEIEEVPEEELRRVADLPVGLGRPREDLLRERVVVRVVERRDPEPDHVGPVGLQEVLRLDRVSERLRHLPAVARDDEAVRQDDVVRRPARERDRGQERRLEPAAVLVVSLEVHDRDRRLRRVRVGERVVARTEDRRVRNAGVEPDVEDVLQLFERGPAAAGAGGDEEGSDEEGEEGEDEDLLRK